MTIYFTNDDVLEFKDNMMVNEKDRLASFVNWPFKRGPCTKSKMAQAGFYKCFEGEQDTVRCVFCLKIFEAWNKEKDNPFTEHLNMSPECLFARLQLPQDELSLKDWLTIIKERTMNVHKLRLEKKVEKMENCLNKLSQIGCHST